MRELKDVLTHAEHQSEPSSVPDFGGLVARSRQRQRARVVLTASGAATAVVGGILLTANLQGAPAAREQLATSPTQTTQTQPAPRQTPQLTDPDAPPERIRSTALLEGQLSIAPETSCVYVRTARALVALVLVNERVQVDYQRRVIVQDGEVVAADGDTVRVTGGGLPEGAADARLSACKDAEGAFAGTPERSSG